MHNGQVLAWVHTNKEGMCVGRPTAGATGEAINSRFLKQAWAHMKESRGASRGKEFLLVERGSQSRALDEPGYQRLMTRLARALQKSKANESSERLPHLLQSFVPIALQMRYVIRVLMDGGEPMSACSVGRVEFRNPDGQRLDKPVDTPVSEAVKEKLQEQAVALIEFLELAHGLKLSSLTCEFVQSEVPLGHKSVKDYILNGVLGFDVDRSTFEDDSPDGISEELDAVRVFLDELCNPHADKVINRLRPRRGYESRSVPLSSSLSPSHPQADPGTHTAGFAELGRRPNPMATATYPAPTVGGEPSPPFGPHSSPTLAGMDFGDLSPAEISRASYAMSVPELAKAVGEVQKLANELLISQEEHMAVGEQQSILNAELKATISSLENSADALGKDVQHMESKHREMIKLMEETKTEFREEKERTQAFKTATLHHFENVKEQISKRKDMCAEQEEKLSATQLRLSCEIERRVQLELAREQLAAEVASVSAQRELLHEGVVLHEADQARKMRELQDQVSAELLEASSSRGHTDVKLTELEKICEMIGWQKYGGMWDDKKKALCLQVSTEPSGKLSRLIGAMSPFDGPKGKNEIHKEIGQLIGKLETSQALHDALEQREQTLVATEVVQGGIRGIETRKKVAALHRTPPGAR
eukprot:TRINITY_DN1970_c0_g1_i3.p1 TRINITY_DN1970_c0_g1~~TRINITY_DN1970_c0_g1_i3.p1  ORF type:complete len:648 (-),score=208.26 TRINITY_DN1970_c0_g1_i3:277-2220(-)